MKAFISAHIFPDLELCGNIQRGWSFPTLCRSGVKPPTGMIHPRKGRGTEDRNQEGYCRICCSRFGVCGEYLAGVDRSGRGFNPRPAPERPAQERPAQFH